MPRFAHTPTCILLSLTLLAAACGPTPAPAPEPAPADPATLAAGVEQAIDGELLRRHVAALSDDAMAGRGPASEGDVAARAYLIEQMTELGLEPGAGDGSWEQPMEIVGITSKAPGKWSFLGGRRGVVLSWWDDFIAASGVQAERAAIDEAELVFVGYGIEAPEYDWNDYKDVDVTGKVLLMLNNDPDWDPELFAGERRLLLRPLDLQVRAGGQPRRRRRDHHPHHAVGRLSVPGRADLLDRRAVRAAGGDEPRSQIEAWVTEEAAAQAGRARRARSGRAGRIGPLSATSSRCRSASRPRSR